MEKEFVPYDESLALKELGFDEDCFGYYVNAELDLTWKFSDCSLYQDTHISILAPLYQQAFRWFREKHGLIGYIQTSYVTNKVVNNRNIPCTPRIEFTFGITNTIGKSIFSSFKQGSFKTYEEAELEGLKKLIENFKQK